MPIIYTWDTLIIGFTSMLEQTIAPESLISKEYAHHALGMLTLIPQIRDFPEFKDFELDMSLGRLVCKSKITKARLYLVCKRDFIYGLEIYTPQTGNSGIKELSLEELVSTLQEVLKELSNS